MSGRADARSVRADDGRALAGRAGSTGLPGGAVLSVPAGRPAEATRLARALRKHNSLDHFAAKDILRAAGLTLLAEDDTEVAEDLNKVRAGTKLSPVLLAYGTPLWIADGYHRVCASYHLDEKAEVPCRMVGRVPKA